MPKFSGRPVQIRSSSPKIIPLCPALYTIASGSHAADNPEKKGHLFEAVVGADLLKIPGAQVYYWRDGRHEVDYVVEHDGRLIAIEVKSSRRRVTNGLNTFQDRFKKSKACVITMESYGNFAKAPLKFLSAFAV